MATATSDFPRTPLDRLAGRVADGRWLIAAVAGVLLVLVGAGAFNLLTGGIVLLALVVALAIIPRSRASGGETTTPPVAPAVSTDGGVRLLADALPDPCFVLDRRASVRYANERARATFNIGVGEALTFRLRVPDLVAAFDRVAKGGEPVRVEFSERVPTERWFAAWFAPLTGTDLIVLVVNDMSERRNADRIRVDFVANASHELRTPLASLAGFIETLQGPAHDDAVARDRFLSIMREQADRMSRLVNDLLSLSRIEMKAHVRPSDRVDLNAVVSHVVDALEPLARDLGVSLETNIPKQPVEVVGDRDELTQVFENLIENACKYGQSGKRVVVTVTAGSDGSSPRVVIQDFGPGIPEEHLPRLTERFYRVNAEDSRRHRGTGLGLAIVKHILARHLGRMTVVSRLGEGATFTVTLPQTAAARTQALIQNSEPDETLRVS